MFTVLNPKFDKMNKIYTFIILIISFAFTSCQFSEDIYINEDGSGKMEFSFDGSQIMQMAGEEMNKTKEEAIDSTFSFKELFEEKRDSISKLPKEEQDRLKRLENFQMHMVMNPATSEMKFGMFSDFKKVSEIQDMFKAMSGYGGMQKNNSSFQPAGATVTNDPFSSFGKNGTELEYTYNGKVFKRIAKIVDKETFKKATDSLGDMAMMFGASMYKLNYHFPRPIKTVSNDKALFSSDRKSFTLEYSFTEYISNPEALNLEIVLED